jgi:hypothetical protein
MIAADRRSDYALAFVLSINFIARLIQPQAILR